MSDPRCKCTMAISMVGDGCRYCQPQEHIDRLGDIISDMETEAEPTHYAVFDEKDEMITACSIERHPDAESMCRVEISETIEQIPQAKDWTVKGVTVHE